MGRTTRRRTLVALTCAAAVLAGGLGTWALVDTPSATAESKESTTTRKHTAPVERGDLTDSKTFAGVLSYGATTSVSTSASGVLTWLPKPGQVVHRDEPLFAMDERPVRAMTGTTPLWRSMDFGDRGADVLQLNENLAALGYDVSVDEVFGRRTLAAVERWQADRGLERTGVVTANDVVFVDGDVRVDSTTGVLGQPVEGEVLAVTSTKRVVTASVLPADADRLSVGTKVQVLVNGAGSPIDGEVVTADPAKSDDGAETVSVTVALDPGRRKLPTAASAQVIAEAQTETDVVTVPVAALVAGSSGGSYAVDVVRRDGTTKRVEVEVGFVAEGRAAVTGDVSVGDEVVVPS